jgi:regulatory protein
LQAKGLPVEAIADAVQAMRSTELARASEVWRKKFGEPAVDLVARLKQVRFLVSRGFSPEVVRKIVAGTDDF